MGFIGLTQALRKLGVLGFLAVTQIKLSDNFCVSPGLFRKRQKKILEEVDNYNLFIKAIDINVSC